MRNVKKYGWIGAGLCVGFTVISGLVPAQETEEIKEMQITQADVEVLAHNVCFNAPPRYIESQFETEIIAESWQNGERETQGCKYLFCKRLD